MVRKKLTQFSANLLSFVVPKSFRLRLPHHMLAEKRVAVIIPTYRPVEETFQLVADLMLWNKNIVKILVVDDCSPDTPAYRDVLTKISKLSESFSAVELIRTPVNRLKVGALNYGIKHLESLEILPDVVVTFDDDVRIDKDTIFHLVDALYTDDHMGAVCSSVRVINKNTNLLTRLQALEYHSFNLTKTADIGFVQGPLVMQGMLTAFRYEALIHVNGFPEGYLIEDYGITARMKELGWHVGMAPKAVGWTDVPESLPVLWRQRIRWTYGGLTVVRDFWRNLPSIIQDIMGHILFLATIILVTLSFIIPYDHSNSQLLVLILVLGLAQFLIGFAFQAITMFAYEDRDGWDWVIRLLLVPEFVYSNILSLVLMGSYLFYLYNGAMRRVLARLPFGERMYTYGLNVFNRLGFSNTWGTR